jgi:hypothetical protein
MVKAMFSTSVLMEMFPKDMYLNLAGEKKRLEPYYTVVRRYYESCASHTGFVFTMVTEMRAILGSLDIQCLPGKLQEARDRLGPILQNFRNKQDDTERASRALLYIIVEYIHSYGFDLKAENIPALAVYGVNAFLVIISSAIVLGMGIQKVVKADHQTIYNVMARELH